MNDNKRYQTFPLRISPSLRREATHLAENEGLSLNHLINMAVAEKISRMDVDRLSEGETGKRADHKPSLLRFTPQE